MGAGCVGGGPPGGGAMTVSEGAAGRTPGGGGGAAGGRGAHRAGARIADRANRARERGQGGEGRRHCPPPPSAGPFCRESFEAEGGEGGGGALGALPWRGR